jgi:hypothetical protein
VIYQACGGFVTLVEYFHTTGDNLKESSINDVSLGKRNFDLEKNENMKIYALKNSEGVEIFRLEVSKLDDGKIATFYNLSQEFMKLRFQDSQNEEEEKRVFYQFHPHHFKYKYKTYFTIEQNPFVFNPFTMSVISRKDPFSPIIYLSSSNQRVTKRTFLDYTSHRAVTKGVSLLASVLKFHIAWFPSTEVVRNVGAGQRFVTELRAMLTRLLNNTEINLVRNYIQKLIVDVEKGLVIDKRPKEEE